MDALKEALMKRRSKGLMSGEYIDEDTLMGAEDEMGDELDAEGGNETFGDNETDEAEMSDLAPELELEGDGGDEVEIKLGGNEGGEMPMAAGMDEASLMALMDEQELGRPGIRGKVMKRIQSLLSKAKA